MKTTEPTYVPALAHDRLTPLYDVVMQLAMREKTFKTRLIEQAGIASGHRVLDVGCGTATLTLMIKAVHPDAELVGLDGDPKVLALAGAKAEQQGLAIQLDQGLSTELPYEDRTFDRVVTSLLFHHLTRDAKMRTMQETLRVLRPGGALHVADWGPPQNVFMHLAFLAVQFLDGFETTSDNARGMLPLLLLQAGFIDVHQTAQFSTMFGTLALLRARKPV